MAYNVIYQGDYAAPTIRDTEDVVCQIAEVTNRQGESLGFRMEARVQVDNPKTGYQGMSKTALVFDNIDAVSELITQLTEMTVAWENEGLGGKAKKAKPEAPAKPKVKRRERNVKAPAGKVA